MNTDLLKGLVTRLQAGFYTVQVDQNEVTCRLRGRFKKERLNEDIVAVGDRVEIQLLEDGSGVIEEILPREKAFIRLAPSARGDYKQVLLANPDQILLVFACANPDPSLRMLDRFLVITEKQSIPVVIVANKVDLIGPRAAEKIFSLYADLGYRVLFTSANKEINIEKLKSLLIGKISALSGPSGVGKSSLLNKVQPGLGLGIGRLKASAPKKGRHTTVVRQLFPLVDGGFVADMPGLRSLSFWDTEPEELDGYFREMRDLVSQCQFNDCRHLDEPGCAVKLAVENGKIHPHRYQSYVRLRLGDDD
jgi:ribosome biogenesis GTPase / thiamine phosphate phosphatase